MTYIIDQYRDNTVLGVKATRQEQEDFWRPFLLSEQLTPEIMQKKPNPILVTEPERPNRRDVFQCMDTWVVSDRVKSIIESLESGVHFFLNAQIVTEQSGTRPCTQFSVGMGLEQ